MTLSDAPRVLVLQLKRFRYDPVLHDMVKVHAEVNFPLELDLGAFIASSSGVEATAPSAPVYGAEDIWTSTAEEVIKSSVDPAQWLRGHAGAAAATRKVEGQGKYELTAVIRHIGVTEASGHYICDVAKEEASSVQARQWRRCDDSSVYAVSEVSGSR
jgi:ubiquitin C-terminal hydrolase